jgi:hypothetical protein
MEEFDFHWISTLELNVYLHSNYTGFLCSHEFL